MQRNRGTSLYVSCLLVVMGYTWSAGYLDIGGSPDATARSANEQTWARAGEREIYQNRAGDIKCSFIIPQPAWRKITHELKTIQSIRQSQTLDSDVHIYSPSDDYIPGFKIIAFTRETEYPRHSRAAIAEHKALWRETRMKELYADRFLGRIAFGKSEISGVTVPKVVYDMQDESRSRRYRSTEYTLVTGKSAVTFQFITDHANPETSRILESIFESLRIETAL